MKKPIVGITTNTLTMAEGVNPNIERSYVNYDYVEALTLAGAVPILLPVIADQKTIEAQCALLDGLVLTGGPDVNPLLYGEEPSDKLECIYPERDEFELYLIKKAVKKLIPILGICRGMQLINVAFGGSLYQDVSHYSKTELQHRQQAKQHVPSHTIDIIPTSKLYQLLDSKQVITNSLHHQAVKKIAPGFIASASARDGLIEGIEKKGKDFIVGVQWHPEKMIKSQTGMQRFFNHFVDVLK